MELHNDSRSEELELTEARQQDENRSIVKQMEELGYIDVGVDI